MDAQIMSAKGCSGYFHRRWPAISRVSKSAIDVQPLYPSTLTLWTEALEAHRNFPEHHLHRHHPSFPQLNRTAFVFSL